MFLRTFQTNGTRLLQVGSMLKGFKNKLNDDNLSSFNIVRHFLSEIYLNLNFYIQYISK